ncbi:hypothetical protein D3C80_1127140 [compost metagenome]
MTTKRFNYVNNRRLLLSDRNVNTFYAVTFLVDDGIDGDCSFTCLTVTDNKLPLAAADWNHRVDRFNTSLHRLVNGFTINYAWCVVFYWAEFCCLDWTFTINWLTKRIYNTSKQSITYWYLHDLSCTFYLIAFTNFAIWTKNNDTDVTFFKVERKAVNTVCKLKEFVSHGVFKSVDTGDTVTNLNNCANFGHFNFRFILFDLTFNQCTDLFRSDTQVFHPYLQCLSSKRLFKPFQLACQTTII